MISVLLLALPLAMAAPSPVPFHIEAIENASADFPDAPRLDSASFAQWNGRWLFIGGRTTGYHAMGGAAADFARTDANRDVWVVDTTCRPARTYHVTTDLFPEKFAILRDEWASTGQASYQDGADLYIAGGYGQNSSGHWVTYPVLSKIELPGFIEGVMQGKLDVSRLAFGQSELVQSAGGELVKLNDGCFYLVMGHVFTGSYTSFEGHGEQNSKEVSQSYLNEIRKLQINSDGRGSVTVKAIQTFSDEEQFHRRDLNVTKVISPRGVGLAAYGGVFTKEQLNYSHPIYLFAGSQPEVDQTFEQKGNTYKSATLSLYDEAREAMYTTFFGGISRYQWNEASRSFFESPRLGDKSASTYLDGLQWSDQVSTIAHQIVNGRPETSEFVHPIPLAAYVGTDARFIPVAGLKRTKADSEVLDLEPLRGKRTLVGYIYGGIRAFPFRFPYDKSAAPYNAGTVPTKPSDLILKVYVTAAPHPLQSTR